MNQLELSITAEQVKSFLGGKNLQEQDFESFLDNSQSPDPTNGKDNYARHILGLAQWMEDFWKIIPFPEEVREYLDKIKQAASKFEWSLQAVTYPSYSVNKGRELQEHYDSIAHLAELYQYGVKLEQKHPNVEELKTANVHLRRQITVANILFDSEKRNIDFRQLMWGPSDRLNKYLDSLYEERPKTQ